ncbi:MAG: hypothetical protein ACR2IK_22970, partial [Chloroflexota bacterium]
LFTSRNLVSVEFAAQQLKITLHSLEKGAVREHGPLLLWVFGGGGQIMRKYRAAYVDMGPHGGPDEPHAWQGHSAEELLGEARKRHADPKGLDGLDYATN